MSEGPWLYADVAETAARQVVYDAERRLACRYCSGQLETHRDLTRTITYPGFSPDEETLDVFRCPRCGWWAAKSPYLNTGGHIMMEVGYGELRRLDLNDLAEPISAIRGHLMLKPGEIAELHPRKLEDVVGSIFSDFGYRARVTAYSADGGIDVYLDAPGDGLVGVQVKRTKRPIEIEQVNSLTGALFVNDCTSGVFVTTSRFRSGVRKVVQKAGERGLPIELYDAKRLFEALEIAQTAAAFEPVDPAAPWMTCVFPSYYKDF